MEITRKKNPQLKQRLMEDGRVSLYLEYYYGSTREQVLDEAGEPVLYTRGAMRGTPIYKVKHNRKKETLHLYYQAKPKNPIERREKQETLALAERIQWEREQQFLEDREGYRLKREQVSINFLDYFQDYIDRYTKKDIRMMRIALQRFRDFLRDTEEYTRFADWIKPTSIDKDMMEAFTEYLQSRSRGEGAHSIYSRWKKVIKYAVEHKVMPNDPCKGISIKIDNERLTKDVLSPDEIRALSKTHYTGENPSIRRAFLFSLYTGLRWCDVKSLTWANVDVSNRRLSFEQNKTKGHSAASGVEVPLTTDVLKMIGKPGEGESRDSLIFDLPSYEAACKAVKRWVKRAGIDKHISWHCARHSFAVNILNNGANIKTVASLLGHSGLRHTEKYTRAVDGLKRKAVNSLPKLNAKDL